MLVLDGRETVVWRPPAGQAPTLAVVDHLCRLQLDAHRRGGELVLRNPCPDLRRLIRLAGLDATFGLDETS